MESGFKLKESSITKPSLRRAVVVEFVGPPGAGKTTSCHYFAELLKENNFNVSKLQDLKDYLREMRPHTKLWLYLKTLLYRGHRILHFTGVLASNKVLSLNSIYRYGRLSVFNQLLEQFVKDKDADIVLLDQWGIQELWSATIFKRTSYTALMDKLQRFYFKTDHVIYFDIDMPTASERISTRNTNLSRFDRIDPEKRLVELIKYNDYLFHLFEKSDCVNKHVFSTSNSPEANAEEFLKVLDLSFLTSIQTKV